MFLKYRVRSSRHRSLNTTLLIVGIVAIIDIIYVLIRLVPMLKRMSEFKKLKDDPDVISVEAEILEIQTKKLNNLDTQYNVKVYYEVGYQKFYKDIILINKQAIRVGMVLTMLCSSSDPDKAMIMDGSDEKGIKSHVINLIIAVPVLLIDLFLNLL